MRRGRGRRFAAIGVLLGTLAVAGALSVAVDDTAPATNGRPQIVADDGGSDCSYDGAVCVPGWKTQDTDG